MTSFTARLTNNASVLLITTALIWGSNAVAGKFAVGEVSPLLLTAFRWGIAAVILVFISRRHLRADWPVLRSRLPYLFVLGAAGFTGFNALLYSALHDTTAINATIIQAGIPLFVFALNYVLYRMALSWGQVVGYGLTLLGVALTAAGGDLLSLDALQINHGDAIMIAAVFLYASYTVALRAKPDVHWLSFLSCLVVAATVVAIPLAAYEATTPSFIWPTTLTGWSVVFYAALLSSIVAQALFIRGNELIGTNKAGLYINLVPLFASILSVLLLGESFHIYHGAALVLVIGGIILAQRWSATGSR